LLQFFDDGSAFGYHDVSDAEAVERTKFDLRWKVALGLSLPALACLRRQVQVDYAGFDPTSLVVFRRVGLRQAAAGRWQW